MFLSKVGNLKLILVMAAWMDASSALPQDGNGKTEKLINVLLVDGKPAKPGFETATQYLNHALAPFARDKPPQARGPVRVRTLSAAQFEDANGVELKTYDCIYVCDVPRFTKAHAERLETFVRNGGAVIFCLGPRVDVDTYNDVLHRQGKGLFPAKLVGVHEAKGKMQLRLAVPPDGYKQAPLAAFADMQERSVLGRPIFKKFMRMEEPSPRAKSRTILSFEEIPIQGDGPKPRAVGPAMLEWRPYKDKGGRVVVFASTVNFDWNSWAASPSFLPMMQEVLRFAISAPSDVKPK